MPSVAPKTASAALSRPGPKSARDLSPLSMKGAPKAGGARVAWFAKKYLRVPSGHGAGTPFTLRPWQLEILDGLLPAEGERPSQGLVSLPRGNGKTSLAAVLALYALFADGVESPQVLVQAASINQAGILFSMARRMVELSPELEKRTKILKDRLVVPGCNGELLPLANDKDTSHGYLPTLAIIDEMHTVQDETWEQMLLSSGKRPNSLCLAISTPSISEQSVMWKLVSNARTNPDPDFYFKEYTSNSSHPIDCQHCIEASNPAYGDFLTAKSMVNVRKTSRESSYRVYRLGQWLEAVEESYLTKPQISAVLTDQKIPKGERVVLFTDGSYSGDACTVVAVQVAQPHIVELVAAWEPNEMPEGYRVPVLDVMNAIRDACAYWNVAECNFDPYRYQMVMETLAAERIPVVAFPQAPARMTPATIGFREAILEKRLLISRSEILERHLLNCRVTESDRGTKVHKKSKESPDKIDGGVSAICAFARASFLATQAKPRRRILRAVG